jgi:hypothetical protein
MNAVVVQGHFPEAPKPAPVVPVKNPSSVNGRETDEQIEQKIGARFKVLERLVDACINGSARSLIVSGPAGLGKSYTVEQKVKVWDPNGINHTIVKGNIRATGLFKLLWEYREAGKVLIFDDADAMWFDEISLGLLKAVCDTTERRRVAWLTEAKFFDDEGNLLPKKFDFEGSIIFITNHDFDAMIGRGHKLKPHFEALISRSHYIDLALKKQRDFLVRIRQVICQGLLGKMPGDQQAEVYEFIDKNAYRLRELSLRMAIKVASIRKDLSDPEWEETAIVTCCRNQ